MCLSLRCRLLFINCSKAELWEWNGSVGSVSIGKTSKAVCFGSFLAFSVLFYSCLIHTSCLFGTACYTRFWILSVVVNAKIVNILTRCVIGKHDTESKRLFLQDGVGWTCQEGSFGKKKPQPPLWACYFIWYITGFTVTVYSYCRNCL